MRSYRYLYFLAINIIFFTGNVFLLSSDSLAQAENFSGIRTEVHFDETIRDWDGFGFNYVETAQTLDYDKDPQEYGGFSLLDENEKMEIVNMVFGEDGLKVGLVKMFYDPWHQVNPNGPFDHKKTTEDETKLYSPSGNYTLKDGKIIFDSPKGSVTTFFGN